MNQFDIRAADKKNYPDCRRHFVLCRDCSRGIGIMLFLQNITHGWESWAYSWTVILILVGLGIFIMGLYTADEHRRQSGLSVMKVGAILFIIFGGFFELLFSAFRPYGLQQYIFPVLLVLLGIYLVVIRSGLLTSKHSDTNGSSINISEEKK